MDVVKELDSSLNATSHLLLLHGLLNINEHFLHRFEILLQLCFILFFFGNVFRYFSCKDVLEWLMASLFEAIIVRFSFLLSLFVWRSSLILFTFFGFGGRVHFSEDCIISLIPECNAGENHAFQIGYGIGRGA